MARRFALSASTALLLGFSAWAQSSAPARLLTDAEREEFLLNAKVVGCKGINKGITNSLRCSLEHNGLTHDAHLQTIDEYKPKFEGNQGSEINFRDSYKYNLAAYRIDRMLGLNMIPTTVFRKHRGSSASFTWWVEDVQMDEAERMNKKLDPPVKVTWNNQMHIVRVFDQLIYNVDRNLGNLLIDKDWHIWMIDHTRAFRLYYDVKEPKNLQMCDRSMLSRLKLLNEKDMKLEVGKWLTGPEIQGVLKRRDKIVTFFETKGDSTLYDIRKTE